MEMFSPPHPGEILKETCLKPLGLTVTKAARALGVTREALSRLVNGKAGVSPEMAIRLSKAFTTTPEMWSGLQQQYDLWHAKQRADQIQVEVLREEAVPL
jgi:addiction module HigA family antidote